MFRQADQIDILEVQFNINGALATLFKFYVGNVHRIQRHEVDAVKTWDKSNIFNLNIL